VPILQQPLDRRLEAITRALRTLKVVDLHRDRIGFAVCGW
jgi:hypothetical protein